LARASAPRISRTTRSSAGQLAAERADLLAGATELRDQVVDLAVSELERRHRAHHARLVLLEPLHGLGGELPLALGADLSRVRVALGHHTTEPAHQRQKAPSLPAIVGDDLALVVDRLVAHEVGHGNLAQADLLAQVEHPAKRQRGRERRPHHGELARLDALRDLDLALAAQEPVLRHLPQVEPHGVEAARGLVGHFDFLDGLRRLIALGRFLGVLGFQVVEREELETLVSRVRDAFGRKMQRLRRQGGRSSVGDAHGETLHVRFFSERNLLSSS
jgi:hypothetical protein